PLSLYACSITRPSLTSLPVNHKLAHGIGSTLALMQARDHGCDEALMLSHDGSISEASSGNIFWLKGDTLFTPSLSAGCLAGTTRDAILRLTHVHEVTVGIDALHAADAVFITNARLGIWPVASLLPLEKHYNTHHPTIQRIATAFEADREAYCATHTKDWV
ncbi:MAG: aminotransferase class IV, partial [Rickettsiales bacterium]|nr:aminotransferase class IV [Rickettsiales bacterium]